MRIGIDMDDTITDSWECLIPHYSKIFNIPEKKLHTGKPYYEAVKHLVTVEEFFYIMGIIYDKVIPHVHLKPHVKETIDKLYEAGHEVYFITARGKGHTNPYNDSKEFLDRHKIKYEKLIVNCSHKDEMCQELGIQLFIDDSYRHCQETHAKGIDVLMPTTYYNKEYVDIPHFDDWREVYDYVERRCRDGESHPNKRIIGRR